MIDKLLGLVPSWVWACLVAGLALATCAERNAVQNERLAHGLTKTSFSDYREAKEKEDKERTRLALEDTERQRELERNRNKAATENINALLAETARTAAARAVAAERGRVLDAAIDAVVPAHRGEGSGDPDALRRAEETAATFGNLLKTCRAEGRSDAGELEDLATQVRGLIRAYDSLTPQPTP